MQNDAFQPEQYRKLLIGDLNISTTEEDLRAYYAEFGQVVDCVVMRDVTTKKSRCFGFVSFASSEQVDGAMSARPHVINGKTVVPKRDVPCEKGELNISTNFLFISGIRENHTREALKSYFERFGTVCLAEITMDMQTGRPLGYAFVTFNDYDPVDKCVLLKSHMISGQSCDVKKALSDEEWAKMKPILDAQQHWVASGGQLPQQLLNAPVGQLPQQLWIPSGGQPPQQLMNAPAGQLSQQLWIPSGGLPPQQQLNAPGGYGAAYGHAYGEQAYGGGYDAPPQGSHLASGGQRGYDAADGQRGYDAAGGQGYGQQPAPSDK